MSVDPQDYVFRTAQSDCCQMPVMSGGICSECREHCEVEYIDEDEETTEESK